MQNVVGPSCKLGKYTTREVVEGVWAQHMLHTCMIFSMYIHVPNSPTELLVLPTPLCPRYTATQVIKPSNGRTILVCNSIGTVTSLQAAIDRPELFDACFVINPNFRELHVSESPKFIQPAVRVVQSLLR